MPLWAQIARWRLDLVELGRVRDRPSATTATGCVGCRASGGAMVASGLGSEPQPETRNASTNATSGNARNGIARRSSSTALRRAMAVERFHAARRRHVARRARRGSRRAPSPSSAIRVGRSAGGSASAISRVVTPVSISTVRAPTAWPAATSVSASPIITAVRTSAPDQLRRGLEQVRLGLADRDPGRRARRDLDRRHDGAGAGPEPALGRVDRVPVGRHQHRAGPDAVGRRGDPQVRELGIEPDDDRVRMAGRLPAVDPLLAHPRRRVGRGHDVEARLAQLALEAARPHRQHAPDRRASRRARTGRSRART